uniref:FYVE-type domain-containing protein n=1 Tax=Alexandrium monilatum TaxID=311494 RepID=A0A7S4Q6A9_9DINO
MALANAAAQLRAATAASGSGAVVAGQASAAAASVAGALSAGGRRARGLLSGLRHGTTEASQPSIPSDGTRCEECGAFFGMLNRRATCSSCDRYMCGACLGRNALSSMTGISCFCGALCPRCREQNVQTGEFESCRAAMESGVSATVTLPKKPSRGGLFGGGGGGGPQRLPAWLSLEAEASALRWASLEQRNGRPAEEGQILIYEILAVRDTGTMLELPTTSTPQPVTLEFVSADDRQTWARYLELATQVLTPESERAALDAARANHRLKEVEERRVRNEERKKQLSENLGMRYTAEAMMARDEARRAGQAASSGRS